MTDIVKTRKPKEIPNKAYYRHEGESQKEFLSRVTKEDAKELGWDASTASHNYVSHATRSRRNKHIPFDCDATARKHNARDRLRMKLAAKKKSASV